MLLFNDFEQLNDCWVTSKMPVFVKITCLNVFGNFSIFTVHVMKIKFLIAYFFGKCGQILRSILHKKCRYSDSFRSVFSHIRTEYRKTWSWSKSPYSVQMWENMDQKNSEYAHFSRSDIKDL